jgi:hypothetical protein
MLTNCSLKELVSLRASLTVTSPQEPTISFATVAVATKTFYGKFAVFAIIAAGHHAEHQEIHK